MYLKTIAGLGLIVGLAACGNQPGERALTGGAIGMGAGAATGELVANDPATGALAGGAIGAATGALTDADDFDLGEPVWDRWF